MRVPKGRSCRKDRMTLCLKQPQNQRGCFKSRTKPFKAMYDLSCGIGQAESSSTMLLPLTLIVLGFFFAKIARDRMAILWSSNAKPPSCASRIAPGTVSTVLSSERAYACHINDQS